MHKINSYKHKNDSLIVKKELPNFLSDKINGISLIIKLLLMSDNKSSNRPIGLENNLIFLFKKITDLKL